MRLRPVPGQPVLVIEGAGPRALVAADVHLGFESGLARSGAYVPSGTRALAERLLDLAGKARAKRIVLLGDVKHTVARSSFQERREVPLFVERIAREVPLLLLLGNHDAGLREAVPRGLEVEIGSSHGVALRKEGAVRGGVGVLHGHARPAADLVRCEALLVGHTHPAVALVDKLQGAAVEPCWVRAPLDAAEAAKDYEEVNAGLAVTIVPGFNPLLGGTPVNTEGLLGPMRRLANWEKGEVYLLDGVFLGTVESLAVPEPVRLAMRARRRQVFLETEGRVPAEVEADVKRFLREEAAYKAKRAARGPRARGRADWAT